MSEKGRVVALRFSLTDGEPVHYRIPIEGVAYGDAASVKERAGREVLAALKENPVSGAHDVFVSTLRRGNGQEPSGIDARVAKPVRTNKRLREAAEQNGTDAEPERYRQLSKKGKAVARHWAAMTPAQRSAEMIRRKANHAKLSDHELRVKLLERGVATAARSLTWAERPNLWKSENGPRAANPQ